MVNEEVEEEEKVAIRATTHNNGMMGGFDCLRLDWIGWLAAHSFFNNIHYYRAMFAVCTSTLSWAWAVNNHVCPAGKHTPIHSDLFFLFFS